MKKLTQLLDGLATAARDRFSAPKRECRQPVDRVLGSRTLRLEMLEDRRLLAMGDLLYTLSDPGTDVQAETEFGASVASDGNLVVVGTPGADVEGQSNVGLVCLYDATTGDLLRTLDDPTPFAPDVLGHSVAISGNTVVVGSPYKYLGAPQAGAAYIYDATTGNLVWTLDNPTPEGGDQFGISVAVSGNTVVVGAWGDNTGGINAGSAYVYDAATGNLLRTLNNPTPEANDTFGFSVAVSGNTVVVGANQDDTGGTNAGSAYIFDAATGNLRRTLNNPTPETSNWLGFSVAASGNTVAVGAFTDDTGATNAGAAYVYDATTGNLLRTIKNPSPASNDEFGYSVALSGNTLVVGAVFDDTGAAAAGSAYIYDATSGNLLRTLNNPTPQDQDFFGHAVAVSGNTVVVGAINDDTDAVDAGAAYVYDAASGSLIWTLDNPTPANDERFGYAVAISGDILVVGAPEVDAYLDDPGATDAGAAYIFDAATGDLLHALSNPTPQLNDNFGHAVAVSGNTVVVGAYQDDTGASNAGSAYIYDAASGSLLRTLNNPTPTDYENFGFSVAVSGNTVVVGAYQDDTGGVDAGSAYIFDATSGNLLWTLNNPTPAAYDYFAISVAVSDNMVVVGASGDDTDAGDAGSAYLYDAATGNLLRRLGAPVPAAGAYFGNGVAISGNTVVAGAVGDDTGAINAGAAHVYDATTGGLLWTLNNPAPTTIHEYFGTKVAVSGNTVVVAAYRDDTSVPDAGSVYVYHATTGSLLATLDNPTPKTDDHFGRSVAISGNRLVVGEPDEEGAALDRGVAHVFDATGNQAPTDISLSGASIAENQPAGTLVGVFSTSDPDPGDSHAYSLVGGDGATDNISFNVVGNALQTAGVFDYETKSTYSIRVQTDDGGGGTYEKAFTISVTDVDEDFGDAPSPYPTLSGDDGARHDANGPTLGPNRDIEPDGQPDPNAQGDDTTGTPDDEDGVTLPVLTASTLNSTTASVTVDLQNADPSSNYLDAWIDFNRDGDWDDSGERIFTSYDLGTSDGTQSITFTIPQDAGDNVVYGTTYARFRLSTTGGLLPTGLAGDGEVEDYPVAVTWFGPPEALNTNAGSDSGGDENPQLTTDGAGNWVAVWQSTDTLGGTIGSDPDILVSRSADAGRSWTAPAPLNSNAGSDSAGDLFPQVTTDGAGNWVAVWESADTLGGTIGTDRDILVSRSTDAGGTWTAPAPLNTNAALDFGGDFVPQVTTDGAGNWVAVWYSSENLGAAIGFDADILVSRSNDGGETWTVPAVLNTDAGSDSGDDYDPQVTTDGAGNWVAVWYSNDSLGDTIGTDSDILVSRSADAGGTWTAPAPLNSNAGSDLGKDALPQVTTDGAGNWVAVWQSTDSLGGTIGTDYDIFVSRSVDAGGTWTVPAPLNTDAGSDSGGDGYAQVTTDGAGNWVAVWWSTDSLGGTIGIDRDNLVARSTDAGVTWTAPAPLNSNAGSDSGGDAYPQVTTDGAGNWVAAWQSNDSLGGTIGTDEDILFARFSEIFYSEVVGRHVFYNNSKWDGHAGFTKGDPAANEFDDAAIATDKTALLPGQTGTFANYTSYPRGINGIMVDIQGLANPVAVADDDLSEFDFRYGNDDTPDDWLPAPTPLEVTVRDIGGGVHRVTFVWADKAIPNKNWVRVIVKAHPNTGLAVDDVFYFGNTIGENTGDFRVDYSDAFDIIWPLLGTPLPIGPDHVADINRDGRIDYSDVFDDLWPNLSGPAPLKPIHPPALPVAPLQSTDSVFNENSSWEIELIWFDQAYGTSSGSDDSEDDPLETAAVDGVFSVYYEE